MRVSQRGRRESIHEGSVQSGVGGRSRPSDARGHGGEKGRHGAAGGSERFPVIDRCRRCTCVMNQPICFLCFTCASTARS